MIGLKKVLLGGAMAAALAVPLAIPAPAQAWWARGHYGWHGGWGWHGGVFVGGPVVVGAPVVVAAPYAYRFIPGHYTPWGAWVTPHWGYY